MFSFKELSAFIPTGLAWRQFWREPFIPVIAAYLLVVAIADTAIEHFLFRGALDLFDRLTPAFKPAEARVYTEFVVYVVVWLAIIGAVGLRLLVLGSPALWMPVVATCQRHWGKILGAGIVLVLTSTLALVKMCALFAALALMPRFIAHLLCDPLQSERKQLPNLAAVSIVSTLLVIAAMLMVSSAWYPVRLANDYREAADRIRLPSPPDGGPISIARDEAVDCVVATEAAFNSQRIGETTSLTEREQRIIAALAEGFHKSDDDILRLFVPAQSGAKSEAHCPISLGLPSAEHMALALKATGDWQSNTGRTLYHHSYLLVPALHLIKYGLVAPIPYLYGLGNTAFHAWLIASDPSVSRYLATFPIAQFVGLLLITGAACFACRSLVVAPLALSAAILSLCAIGFDIVQLAAGFSPLRYGGLAVQIASIFLAARTRPVFGVTGLLLSLALSLLWNREYGAIGCTGQALALLTIYRNMKLPLRSVWMIVMAVLAFAINVWLGFLSRGYVETIQTGIFGIATTTIERETFIQFVLAVICGSMLLAAAAQRFANHERDARLCMIPVLGLLLMKYIYYAAPVHLFYTMVFITPMLLVYADWQGRLTLPGWLHLDAASRRKFTAFALVAIALLACASAVRYASAAAARAKVMIDAFEVTRWDALGETFETPTPAEPIDIRVKALRAELKPDDTVLILSPFDHLLAIYANPRRYCGHFENVTNLVSYDIISRIVGCARLAPEPLVVVDAAMATPCPTNWRKTYINSSLCQSKRLALLNLKTVFDALHPNLALVKTVGPLSFYRRAVKGIGASEPKVH